MKKCLTCNIEKRNSNFYGVRNECKECKKNRSSRYYKKNRDLLPEYGSLVCRQPEIILKFFKCIKIPNDKNHCWIWEKSKARKGYGQFYIGKKALRAHRVSYLIFKGNIDTGLLVCHTCDNPSCVNPHHLWLGTNMQNSQDKIKKGRFKVNSE